MTFQDNLNDRINKPDVVPSNHKLSYNPLSYIIDSLIQALKRR